MSWTELVFKYSIVFLSFFKQMRKRGLLTVTQDIPTLPGPAEMAGLNFREQILSCPPIVAVRHVGSGLWIGVLARRLIFQDQVPQALSWSNLQPTETHESPTLSGAWIPSGRAGGSNADTTGAASPLVLPCL